MAVERITRDEAARRLAALSTGVIGPGLPRRRRDRWILLYGAVQDFAPGTTLDEKTLNEKLKTWLAARGPHTSLDHVTVRRALVDESFVERSPDGRSYKRSRAHERWVTFEEVAMPNETNTLAGERCTACRGDSPKLSESEVAELALSVKDWMVVDVDGVPRLVREFTFIDFAKALAFTNRVGAIAEQEGHHPALLTEWGRVTVSWWTHKIRGLHRNDFVMAAKTDALPR